MLVNLGLRMRKDSVDNGQSYLSIISKVHLEVYFETLVRTLLLHHTVYT